MWKSKLNEGEQWESDYAFKSRQEYCYYVSENPSERKTIPGFLKFCEKRISNCEFTGPKKPNENTIYNFWFDKWKWEKSARQYMKDNADDGIEYAILIYDTDTLRSTQKLMRCLDGLYDDLEDAIDDTYENELEKRRVIDKITDDIDKLEKLIRLKLGKSVSNTQNKNHTEIRPEGLKRLEDAFK